MVDRNNRRIRREYKVRSRFLFSSGSTPTPSAPTEGNRRKNDQPTPQTEARLMRKMAQLSHKPFSARKNPALRGKSDVENNNQPGLGVNRNKLLQTEWHN